MTSPTTLTDRVEAVLDPGTDRRRAGAELPAGWLTLVLLSTVAIGMAGPPHIKLAPPEPDNPSPPVSSISTVPVPSPREPSKQFDPPIPPSPRETAAANPAESPPAEKVPNPATPEPRTDSAPVTAPPAKSETAASKPPFDWRIITKDGRDHIPVSVIKAFYKFSRLEPGEAGGFTLRSKTMSIAGTTGSNEMRINNVRFFLTFPVEASDDGPMISRLDLALMLDPIIRPTYIKGFKTVNTVVIDAGPGGIDSGVGGILGKNSAYTLDTALRLQRRLQERGLKTIVTRSGDTFLSVNERSAMAAAVPDAVLVSLQFVEGPPTRKGIQTYFPEKAAVQPGPVDDSAYHASCVGLATAVHANALYKLRSTDGGIRSAGFPVINGQTRSPAILIECGYLSHPEEGARIATESYRQSLADGIAGGVQNYIRARQKRSTVPVRQ